MIEVSLSRLEVYVGSMVGAWRQVSALELPDRHGYEGKAPWDIHINGVLGEMAAAKALGVYYSFTINTFKDGGDISSDLQVRTRSRHDWDLIVRHDDRDEDRFILVTGTAPKYAVHGWLYGHEAKQSQWLQAHGGREAAYFVPQSALRDLGEVSVGVAA